MDALEGWNMPPVESTEDWMTREHTLERMGNEFLTEWARSEQLIGETEFVHITVSVSPFAKKRDTIDVSKPPRRKLPKVLDDSPITDADWQKIFERTWGKHHFVLDWLHQAKNEPVPVDKDGRSPRLIEHHNIDILNQKFSSADLPYVIRSVSSKGKRVFATGWGSGSYIRLFRCAR